MERVLILTIGFGTGHNAAARVLSVHLEQKFGLEVRTVDLLELVPGKFHPFLKSGYGQMLNRFPSFYSYLYDRTSHSRFVRYVSSEFVEKTGWMIRKKLVRILDRFAPTRIVTTHPFGLLMLPSQWRNLPTVGVVTDYEMHPFWLAEVPNCLCIPNRLFDKRRLKRISWQTGTRLAETGIPCDPAFSTRIPRQEARRRAGLDPDRPMILVMGGGLGFGPLPEIVDSLVGLDLPAQILVLTGKNTELYSELKAKDYGTGVHVFRYRRDVPVLMDAADLLVTKPGGLSVTEAILKQLPMLLFEALPGQEYANQQYLLHHGGAVLTRPDRIWFQASRLLANPDERRNMERHLEGLAFPDAPDRIAREVLEAERLDTAL
ncbi:MGDG synthase family glycosyltransferase [Paludifilum halophilum]|uniref:Galactosyldiacylglycerol synthase n=1 Tax=Paludifilum halophilum TaxID=1642702 RepID=A0A235BA88_9BACL|nr:glycosyltransferase [Paludifilum halophilum]OYD09142.1 hypothetical protein CHM34_05095 [Paludifilum halophilum]